MCIECMQRDEQKRHFHVSCTKKKTNIPVKVLNLYAKASAMKMGFFCFLLSNSDLVASMKTSLFRSKSS